MLDRSIKLLPVLILIIVEVSAVKISNETVDHEEICKTQLCIPKCCPEGQFIYGVNKRCMAKKKIKQDFSRVPLYHSNLTKSGRFLSELHLVPGMLLNEEFKRNSFDFSQLSHRFYLTEKGILIEESTNVWHRFSEYNNSLFCVDYALTITKEKKLKPEIRFLTALPRQDVENEEVMDSEDPIIITGLLVSCFFMTLVLIVYVLLKELRNLTGKVLMAYVASLLIAFILLVIIKLTSNDPWVCKALSYATYYSFLACFCWMNIMSCDIWWTFRGYAKARPIHRKGENFKFGMYSIYAWGLPAALTTMVIVMDNIDLKHVPWVVTPNINLYGCFFGDEEKLLYLYIPMLVLIFCNWIFYLMTAFNIWRLHRATAMLDSAAAGTPAAHRSQKFRFLVYLKLSIIMGINWALEVFSSFNSSFKVWYIADCYNVIIGLSIFLIFVCKKEILRKLVKRFGGVNEWQTSRPWLARSRSSNTSESDISAETPVCGNPKGPAYCDKR